MAPAKKRKNQEAKRKTTGPRLPKALRKEIDALDSRAQPSDEDEDGIAADVYEYEEALAEEETKKNRRFDPVENYEYELPEDFEVSPFI